MTTATETPVVLQSYVIVGGNGRRLALPFSRTLLGWTDDDNATAEFSSQGQAKLVLDEIKRLNGLKWGAMGLDDPNAGYSLRQRAYVQGEGRFNAWDAAERVRKTGAMMVEFLAEQWSPWLRGGAK